MKKLIAAAVLAALIASPAYAALSVGAKAPDFAAQGSLGGKNFDFKLAEALKKGPVVIYFFPAAYTAGCTAETKAFADAADQFSAAGATLIGLTGKALMADGKMANAKESQERLKEFAAEHCRDKFPIAAVDPATIKAFDVAIPERVDWSARTSYVIAPDGKVLVAYSDPKPDGHITTTLDAVKAWKAAHKH